MLRYDFRFWDNDNKRMVYGGISADQLPVIAREDGSLIKLVGNFVPMIRTSLKAVNGGIWEGDIIECDMPMYQIEGMPITYVKTRGVMQYDHRKATFTVSINSSPEMAGVQFQVVNSHIVGNAFANPELLEVSNNQNDKHTQDVGKAT